MFLPMLGTPKKAGVRWPFRPRMGPETAGVRWPRLEEGVMSGGKALGWMAGTLIWMLCTPGKHTLSIHVLTTDCGIQEVFQI